MSCMILKPETLKTLAKALCTLYESSDCRQVYGFFVDSGLYRLLRDEGCTDRHGYMAFDGSVAAMLYRYNHKAYNGRYKESAIDDAQIDFGSVDGRTLMKHVDWNDGKPVIADWHFQLAAMLDCYLYQIAEDATHDTELYHVLYQQTRLLKDSIITADPRYNWRDL